MTHLPHSTQRQLRGTPNQHPAQAAGHVVGSPPRAAWAGAEVNHASNPKTNSNPNPNPSPNPNFNPNRNPIPTRSGTSMEASPPPASPPPSRVISREIDARCAPNTFAWEEARFYA